MSMSDTQTIKDRIDVVQLIGEYIQLKKAGANWKANCPFHHEKTPSFMVHPEKQIWHCFGCQKGGDIFSFIQEIEGLEFPEALRLLAERAGVKLTNNFQNEVNKSQKNRILEINAKAAYFFNHFLTEIPAALKARDYLRERKISNETIEEWQIGFVPDQWDLLTKYLLKKGLGIDDIVSSGLAIKKDGADGAGGRGYYDRFRGRIMFPIRDAHGNIVGFTGRVLVETEKSGGKYVNTPQTLVYDKSRVLYGLDKAKMEIKNKDLAVLVEGQMDVISCHQAGMKNVVAISGTALTLEQVKLLKRYTNNISVAFDADAAGQSAAKRGIDVALEQGMNTKIIQIPDGEGKDADECIKKKPPVWFGAVEAAKDVLDWYFTSTLKNIDLNNPKQKQKAADILLTEIKRLPFPVERDHWLKKLGEQLGVETKILREEINKVDKKILKTSAASAEKENKKEKIEETQEEGKAVMLMENLWALLIKFPNLISFYWTMSKKEYFFGRFLTLYELVNEQYNIHKVNVAELSEKVGSQENGNLVDVLLLKADKDYADYVEIDAKKEVGILLEEIKKLWVEKRRSELLVELNRAKVSGDEEKVRSILEQMVKIGK